MFVTSSDYCQGFRERFHKFILSLILLFRFQHVHLFPTSIDVQTNDGTFSVSVDSQGQISGGGGTKGTWEDLLECSMTLSNINSSEDIN